MQLTVRDISKLLAVSERTVYRWIKKEIIPAYRIQDQYRFNKAEILEWANANKIGFSSAIFEDPQDSSITVPNLTEALRTGGIYYRIAGVDKESVLKSVVDVLRLPEEIDSSFLFQALLSREALGSTAIGDGIAIPHVRNPIILNVSCSIISLCFLETPVDFGALDRKPVYCLFTIISPTARTHLQLLSQLAFALKDSKLKQTIANQGNREDILNQFKIIDDRLKKHL